MNNLMVIDGIEEVRRDAYGRYSLGLRSAGQPGRTKTARNTGSPISKPVN